MGISFPRVDGDCAEIQAAGERGDVATVRVIADRVLAESHAFISEFNAFADSWLYEAEEVQARAHERIMRETYENEGAL